MYFYDRAEAGDILAKRLIQFKTEDTVVLALSPGGVLVGEQIARRLHTDLMLLVTSRIAAPGDNALILGSIDQTGEYTSNELISAGQMEEYMQDFRNWVEEEKLRRMYDIAVAVNGSGEPVPARIIDKNVIIATDGVKNGLSFQAARHFLKKLRIKKMIGAIPVGPGEVIEELNHQLDELYYLKIPDNFISVGHYYTNEPPITEDRIKDALDNVLTHWI